MLRSCGGSSADVIEALRAALSAPSGASIPRAGSWRREWRQVDEQSPLDYSSVQRYQSNHGCKASSAVTCASQVHNLCGGRALQQEQRGRGLQPPALLPLRPLSRAGITAVRDALCSRNRGAEDYSPQHSFL
ncbi:hypothetical protein NDU88_010628 [Pleurodeles waltl]|uniref:Uncharacterized protein n=1 Tax=Pleurodeles waltl TaxID=8319 RepID=A0AAV7PYX0_PLEWA|nr:hypothetical protein NDU88_010628 [Pleurodeles waltl]